MTKLSAPIADALPRGKYIRLPEPIYANPANGFFVTVDALDRRFFSKKHFNDLVVARRGSLAVEKRCPVKMYCLMPTHLHLLISEGSISVIRWMALFKQCTQHLASEFGIQQPWQRSFYDHCLRPTDSEGAVHEYVRYNPVRAGLVSDPDDRPWTGSVAL